MIISQLVFLAVCLLLSAREAYAYLDPGSGSYMFQIVLAGLFASVYTLRQHLKRVIDFVSRLIRRR